MNIKYPLQSDQLGQTAKTDSDRHIADMIEQVLFTTPGERVNRPTFGSGLMQLVFKPNSDELASTIRFLVQGALQQFLGDLIIVNDVEAKNEDSTLEVTIDYTIIRTKERQVRKFSK
jgi:phage baseplate assembly protein W